MTLKNTLWMIAIAFTLMSVLTIINIWNYHLSTTIALAFAFAFFAHAQHHPRKKMLTGIAYFLLCFAAITYLIQFIKFYSVE
jgi:hypothetical protein